MAGPDRSPGEPLPEPTVKEIANGEHHETTYDEAVEAITRPIGPLARYSRRTRWWVWVAIGGLVVALVGLTLAWVAIAGAASNRSKIAGLVRVNSALVTQLAGEAHQARVDQCNQANAFRQGDLTLWTKILGYPPSAVPTAQQKANEENFRKFITAHDKLIDCSRLP